MSSIFSLDDELDLMDLYIKQGDSMTWCMLSGERRPLCDMSNNHIKNCISMLNGLRKNPRKQAWVSIFEDVLLKRRYKKISKLLYNE